jgi:hypothetical protein
MRYALTNGIEQVDGIFEDLPDDEELPELVQEITVSPPSRYPEIRLEMPVHHRVGLHSHSLVFDLNVATRPTSLQSVKEDLPELVHGHQELDDDDFEVVD